VPGAHSLERGLWFVSSAHGEEDVERTLAAAAEALSKVVDERSAR
jgi:glutamate-1-semialdehyde aminotransferase